MLLSMKKVLHLLSILAKKYLNFLQENLVVMQ